MTVNEKGLEALLPCPFCGSAPYPHVQNGSPLDAGTFWQYVWCNECGAHGKEAKTEAEAIAAWNRRAASKDAEPASEVVLPIFSQERYYGNEVQAMLDDWNAAHSSTGGEGGVKAKPLETASHRHKKRGTEYVLLGYGKMQAEDWYDRYLSESVDMREVAIYRSVDDGSLWVRPREAFADPAPSPARNASTQGN